MVTLHEVITFLVSMQISISSLQTHNVNRCGRSRHLARKLSLRRKRSSPNVFEMAATETITSIILIKLGLETLVIIMVANKYAFLQITRRRFLNEWEAFKKVISRRNIRRRITIPLTLSNLKLLRRITRTENILH